MNIKRNLKEYDVSMEEIELPHSTGLRIEVTYKNRQIFSLWFWNNKGPIMKVE